MNSNKGYMNNTNKNVLSLFTTQNNKQAPMGASNDQTKPTAKSVWAAKGGAPQNMGMMNQKPANTESNKLGIFQNKVLSMNMQQPLYNSMNMLGQNSTKVNQFPAIIDSEMNDSDVRNMDSVMNFDMDINGANGQAVDDINSIGVDKFTNDNIKENNLDETFNLSGVNSKGFNILQVSQPTALDTGIITNSYGESRVDSKPQTFEEMVRHKYGIFKII
jgi:hypothetical protein